MYISYSGYKKYKECPRSYWHAYIAHTPVQCDNCLGSLFGSTLGTVFENFYTHKVWRHPNPVEALSSTVKDVAKDVIQKELKRGKVLIWKDRKMREKTIPRSLEALTALVRQWIPNGLKIICSHRLLGSFALAELKLDSPVRNHILGGRCDFLIERLAPYRDRVIVDGKGSSYRDKYTSVRQLTWYAMLHHKKFGRLPDQVAFLFWRSSPETAMDWSVPTIEDVKSLEETVLSTLDSIERRNSLPMAASSFPTKPQPGKCKLCSYLPVCPEGLSMTSENPPPVSAGTGVEDVSLD